ncbi:alpha/beta hydrolase [uncultured Thiodictyon sp.]|uniref:alpha/beta fold hydrolase n=1 Tax=uncultured Thiodictyon sp. TaxID=1846217 RepID=UPI0025FFC205|nr:alpha/beta hydrolase [uncultured Thiodictyon sp.]
MSFTALYPRHGADLPDRATASAGRPWVSRLRAIALLVLIGLAVGCTDAVKDSAGAVNAVGQDRRLVTGAGFEHLTYRHGIPPNPGEVRVYLEGDGLPWVSHTRIARDPSPRTPLALRLMAQDPAPSLYLGRPCYHGLAHSSGCAPWLWTHGRYSVTVVDSMVAALRRAVGPKARISLIGYSGGGALAMLMAGRMDNVERVVTIAANLDIDAWADLHGYSRLSGSLNPAAAPPLPGRVRQIHLAGGRDLQVPASLGQAVGVGLPEVVRITFPDFDHRCCWEGVWPSVLATLEQPDSADQAASLRRLAAVAAGP